MLKIFDMQATEVGGEECVPTQPVIYNSPS